MNYRAHLLTDERVIIVGAGLGGLGAAIAILLAGHTVTVLESAAEIAEVSIHSFPSPSRRYYN
jgi:salicylate hydroxylase